MKKRQKSFKDPLRSFMSTEFRNTREKFGLTQAQMAEKLGIDVRSYSYLESGVHLCSTPVLLRYITEFKQIEIERNDGDKNGKKITVPDVEFVQEVCHILSSADSQLV